MSGRFRPVVATLIGLALTAAACADPSATLDPETRASRAPTTTVSSSTSTTQPSPPPTTFTPLPNQLQTSLDEWLVETGTVGAVALVSMAGSQPVGAAAGWFDREDGEPLSTDDVFRIGSITKVFTGALVMKLVEDGLLGLDDSLGEYLPTTADEITVGRLLSHTSGLRDVDVAAGILAAINGAAGAPTPQESVRDALANLAFEPGTRQSYSSIGYLLLGEIIEEATDQTYEAALAEMILDPLGLAATELEDADSRLPTPYERLGSGSPQIPLKMISTTSLARAAGAAGGLVAPAGDVLAFAEALFAGKVVSAQSLELMQDATTAPRRDYGLGLAAYTVDGATVYGHNGRTIGFASSLRHDPKSSITVVVLSNDGSAPVDELAEDLLREALGGGLDLQQTG